MGDGAAGKSVKSGVGTFDGVWVENVCLSPWSCEGPLHLY